MVLIITLSSFWHEPTPCHAVAKAFQAIVKQVESFWFTVVKLPGQHDRARTAKVA